VRRGRRWGGGGARARPASARQAAPNAPPPRRCPPSAVDWAPDGRAAGAKKRGGRTVRTTAAAAAAAAATAAATPSPRDCGHGWGRHRCRGRGCPRAHGPRLCHRCGRRRRRRHGRPRAPGGHRQPPATGARRCGHWGRRPQRRRRRRRRWRRGRGGGAPRPAAQGLSARPHEPPPAATERGRRRGQRRGAEGGGAGGGGTLAAGVPPLPSPTAAGAGPPGLAGPPRAGGGAGGGGGGGRAAAGGAPADRARARAPAPPLALRGFAGLHAGLSRILDWATRMKRTLAGASGICVQYRPAVGMKRRRTIDRRPTLCQSRSAARVRAGPHKCGDRRARGASVPVVRRGKAARPPRVWSAHKGGLTCRATTCRSSGRGSGVAARDCLRDTHWSVAGAASGTVPHRRPSHLVQTLGGRAQADGRGKGDRGYGQA